MSQSSSAAAKKDAFEGQFTIPVPPKLLLDLDEAKEDVDKFVNIIASDASVSAQLLIKVNSPYYGLKTQVSSIPQAVLLLGMPSVLNLVRGLELKAMTPSLNPNYLESFWHSCLLVALVCKNFAKKLPFQIDAEEAYTIGLFHNCGIPLILSKYSNYQDILKASYHDDHGQVTEVEDHSIQCNHSAIGYLVARAWRLPEWMCQCILEHHNVKYLNSSNHQHPYEKNYLSILKMAEHFCGLHKQIGDEKQDFEWEIIKKQVCDCLGISFEDYQQYSDEIYDDLEEIINK